MKAHQEYLRGFAAGLRHAIIVALGGECSRCHKIRDPAILHVDHKKGGGTKHRKTTGTGPVYYKSILRDIRKGLYRLLCANCDRKTQYILRHRKRHNDEKGQ